MSLKDDIEKWGQPWTDMVRVVKEREPRTILIADAGSSEALLANALALSQIGRGVAVHVSDATDEPSKVMLFCLPWIVREKLSSFVLFARSGRLAIGRTIGGCDMLCLAGDSPTFEDDAEYYVPLVHQNGAIWVTGVSVSTPAAPLQYIAQLSKLSINDVDQKFRLFVKKHWTPLEPVADHEVQTA